MFSLNPIRVLGAAIDALAPLPPQAAIPQPWGFDELEDPPTPSARLPRMVEGRGLTIADADVEWIDSQGHQWRHTHGEWLCGSEEGWAPITPIALFAPYVEAIPEDSSTDAVAYASATSDGPSVEDRPASTALPPSVGAGPPIDPDHLRTAAYAIHLWLNNVEPEFSERRGWSTVGRHLVDYADALEAPQ